MRRGRRRKLYKHHIRHHHTKPYKLKSVDHTRDIDSILARRKLLQDILGFSAEGVTGFFQDGLAYLQANQFDEALKIFNILTRINPYVADFWIAQGIVHQALENNKEALASFLMAQTMDPFRIEAYLNAIECCIQLRDYSQGEALVKRAIQVVRKLPHDEQSIRLLQELGEMIERIYDEKLEK